MIKSIKTIMRQDRERYVVPRRVQNVIPIQAVWEDGIFRVGNKFSKTYCESQRRNEDGGFQHR